MLSKKDFKHLKLFLFLAKLLKCEEKFPLSICTCKLNGQNLYLLLIKRVNLPSSELVGELVANATSLRGTNTLC